MSIGADLTASGSIILVGMPGVGKSTLGHLLAQRLQQSFVDTDHLIEADTGQSLQEYLDQQGYLALREQEARSILARTYEGCVVATGGSAVYSDAAMRHLKMFGTLVFLRDELETIRGRIDNFSSRGIASAPGQSFESLFTERNRLYVQWADRVLDVHDQQPGPLVDDLLSLLTS